ncbi:glycosaminoglycan xylosylkinase-like [Penaeus monodon]|uniref:glycosaminoglycan xylosylkinase-like n=1 Tax=Penaeus monodon TaxID=6687 RepID=UPI0018A7B77E|nr:glycosaminoglycan xylosylkinase-like [Penaeus monodon]
MKYRLLIRVLCCVALVWLLTASVRLGPPGDAPETRTSFQPVYTREIYCKDGHVLQGNKTHCPGLVMLSSLFAHLPAIKAKFSSESQHLIRLFEGLKKDIMVRGVAKDPWALARTWASPNSLVPETAPGLGDILAALSNAPITAADVAVGVSQLKIILQLEGNQKVMFLPKIYPRNRIIKGKNKGGDRFNGEIVAFHLARLLGLQMAPIVSGRKVSLNRQILPVASRKLAKTFTKSKDGRTCFYGVCRYCRPEVRVCDGKDSVQGAVTMWLPRHLPLLEIEHPWRFNKWNNLARWENDEDYCEEVLKGNQGGRILDLSGVSVLDYLIQNVDRHHATYIAGEPNSSLVTLDNGKSFADPETDYMDIMAPVIQCCRFRQDMYARLVLLSGGGLSRALRELLGLDPLAPVLADAHLRALDRRLAHVLAALSACSEKKGGWHNVLF